MTKPQSHSLHAGFTLVELLVAMAVLAIILVAAAKILSTTAVLTTVNNKHMDANDQARMVFDRMADDFARIIKRKDVDYIFWKNTPANLLSPTTGVNDAMYFYTEGASYFDSSTFSTLITGYLYPELEKNSVSLVGYRVNNTPTTGFVAPYYQLERLGKALSWDGQAGYNTSQTQNSQQPNAEVPLAYPPAGNDVVNGPSFTDPTSIVYSAAYFTSTLAGAYSNNASDNFGALPSAVGTYPGGSPVTTIFNDSTDTSYRGVGSQVFRFEYSFQLKDGTFSDKPMMVYSAASSNGVPSSTITANQRPLPTDDSLNDNGDGLLTPTSVNAAIGSRWWDKTNHIGYICLDATPNYAVWHEIGIQDVAAIIVTIAVIDKQGLVFVNAKKGDLSKIAAKLLDYSPTLVYSSVTGNPAYLLDPAKSTAPVSWAYALLPGKTVSTTAIVGSTKLPQAMISQIRLYQRFFYLNNF